jgi:hypothetical protein
MVPDDSCRRHAEEDPDDRSSSDVVRHRMLGNRLIRGWQLAELLHIQHTQREYT